MNLLKSVVCFENKVLYKIHWEKEIRLRPSPDFSELYYAIKGTHQF